MAEQQWIPFLEAIKRVGWRLFLSEFEAKPLLRAACSTERVKGRGQYDEPGRVAFALGDHAAQDPALVRVGSVYYVRETYPAEIDLRSLQAWIASMEIDHSARFALPILTQPQQGGHHNEKKNRSAQRASIVYAVAKLGDRLKGLQIDRQLELIEGVCRAENKVVPGLRTFQRYLQDQGGN